MDKEIQTQQTLTNNTDVLLQDARIIIEEAQRTAYRSINETLIKRNWLLGMRIQHEVLNENRAGYGEQIIKELAKRLTDVYGKGFSMRSLYYFVKFYQTHNDLFVLKSDKNILQALPAKLSKIKLTEILQSLHAKSPHLLSWTHYVILQQVENRDAYEWYENESIREMWSTRTLQRNVSSQYYFRLLRSQHSESVRNEMRQLTTPLQDKLEYLKNPVVAEFLGFKNNTDYTESSLEQSIIDHLIPFLMELGKGFALVDRQKRIHTEKEDYYIDLVFYNYHLRCFVLIDLKTTKLSYQDVGQMDMYVKMYDELVRPDGHNPTIGMLLCAETDEDVAHYSVLNGNDQLFAAKYLTYMPTQEELRREIEQQKDFFRLQNPK